jgi:hypothetical protein
LITLEQTWPFYQRLGFGKAHDPPSALKLEMAAGGLVAKLATGWFACRRTRMLSRVPGRVCMIR